LAPAAAAETKRAQGFYEEGGAASSRDPAPVGTEIQQPVQRSTTAAAGIRKAWR